MGSACTEKIIRICSKKEKKVVLMQSAGRPFWLYEEEKDERTQANGLYLTV